jgi:hypothetical protein
VNYLNQENRGNHPSPKLLPCLLSRLKLVALLLIDKSVPTKAETAYPRFKNYVTSRELIEIYTPTQQELALANQYTKKGATKLGFLVLLQAAHGGSPNAFGLPWRSRRFKGWVILLTLILFRVRSWITSSNAFNCLI